MLPQADSPEQAASACSSPRSCVASFPVREEHGMLWVWPGSCPASAARSSQRPLPLPGELEAPTPGGSPRGALLGGW